MTLRCMDPPLRSLLFVPGDNLKMIRKAWVSEADAIIIDLEDAVAECARQQARGTVRQALTEANPAPRPTFVRINLLSNGYCEDDVEAALHGNLRGLVLPKCESVKAVSDLDSFLDQQEKAWGLSPGSIPFLLLIESAKGLLRLNELAHCSQRITGIVFGAEDFCLDTGIEKTAEGIELLYPRTHVVICARAGGCQAIDTVFTSLNDVAGLRRESEKARQLGFSGKLAIHPRQIETIHAAFAPSEEEVRQARKIVETFDEAQRTGRGVVVLDGRMIDRPVVERARRIIARPRFPTGA